MVFSSLAFLYLFLPCALIGHLALPHRFRLAWLLLTSLCFYGWAEGRTLLVLLGSILWNFEAGWWIQSLSNRPMLRRITLICGIVINLTPLLLFKYYGFFKTVVVGPSSVTSDGTTIFSHTPLGISFFTFQGISYLVDIYRREVVAERSLIAFGAYKALFPQLIAGPIVRYKDVVEGLRTQVVSMGEKAAGIERFVVGLAKKVLIADALAIPADRAFSLDQAHLSTEMAWAGILCYSLQLYFDFSGYSDMAIGIGRILGFRIPENFNLPYTATSVRDFWRRWHISLSTWFRDYLYFPLGGSRGSSIRTVCNLSTVFVLCGLWHGANWTFLIWGALHGFFMGCEHFGMIKPKPLLGRLYCGMVILLSWVIFRAPSLHSAVNYYGALLGQGSRTDSDNWRQTMGWDTVVPLIIAFVLAIGGWDWLMNSIVLRPNWQRGEGSAPAALRLVRTWSFLFLATISLLGHAYSPFIYFRF